MAQQAYVPANVSAPLLAAPLQSALHRHEEEPGDQDIVQAFRSAMPLEAQLRSLPTLVPEEWSAVTMSYPQLSNEGAISLAAGRSGNKSIQMCLLALYQSGPPAWSGKAV